MKYRGCKIICVNGNNEHLFLFVSRLAKCSEKMDNADSELERGNESICDIIRGTSADERIRHKLIYTDYLTPSNSPKANILFLLQISNARLLLQKE
jgi:hypothetical protein